MKASTEDRAGIPDMGSLMKKLGVVDSECVDTIGKEQTEQIENLKVQVETLLRILALKDKNMDLIFSISNELTINAFYDSISENDYEIKEKLKLIELEKDNTQIAQELLSLIYENHLILPKFFDTLAELLERIKDFVGTATKSTFTRLTNKQGPSLDTQKILREIVLPMVEMELREQIRNELEPEIRRQLINSTALRNEITEELRSVLVDEIRASIENEVRNKMEQRIRAESEREFQARLSEEKSNLQKDFERRIKELEMQIRQSVQDDKTLREKIADEERQKIRNNLAFRNQIANEERGKLQNELANNQSFRNMIISEERDRIESELLNNPSIRDQIINEERGKIEAELQSKFNAEARKREDSMNRAHASEMDILREQLRRDAGMRSSVEADIRPLIESRLRSEFEERLSKSISETRQEYQSQLASIKDSIEQENNNTIAQMKQEFDQSLQKAQNDFDYRLKTAQNNFENEKQKLAQQYESDIRNNKEMQEGLKEALLREIPQQIGAALKSDTNCQNNATEVFSLVIKALGLEEYSKAFTMERLLKQTTRLATDVIGARSVFKRGTVKQCVIGLVEQNRSLEQSQTMTRALLVRQSTEIDALRRSIDSSEWLKWCRRLYGELTGFGPSAEDVDELRFAVSEEVSALVARASTKAKAKEGPAFMSPSDLLLTPTMKGVPQIAEVDKGSPPTYSPSPAKDPQSPWKANSPLKVTNN